MIDNRILFIAQIFIDKQSVNEFSWLKCCLILLKAGSVSRLG